MSAEEMEGEGFASRACGECEALTEGLAALVNETRGRDSLPGLQGKASSLASRCYAEGVLEAAALAEAIALGCELLFDGQVDPGQAILLLASGTETLQKSIVAHIQRSEGASDHRGAIAARYELETLFPVPGQTPKANKGGPDVTLHRLRKR